MAEHVSNSEYVGIDARSSYVSTEHDASNREALYTIFPETVPKSAKVSDFGITVINNSLGPQLSGVPCV